MTPIVSYMPCRDIPSKIHHCVKYWPKGYHYSFTRACFALQRRLLSNNKVLSLVLYLWESAASPQKKDIYVQAMVYRTWNPPALKVEKWALVLDADSSFEYRVPNVSISLFCIWNHFPTAGSWGMEGVPPKMSSTNSQVTLKGSLHNLKPMF